MTNEERAAPALSESMVHNKNTAQFVGFQLADQEYAFRIERIQEIVILEKVTCVPQVPAYVDGVSNLRGAIIPIINLRKLFGIDPRPSDEETRTIVVNVGARTMGCTVDSVSQVMRIPPESIHAAPDSITPEGTAYVTGFAKLDGRLLILLDIDELLGSEKMETVYHAAQQGAALPELSNNDATTI